MKQKRFWKNAMRLCRPISLISLCLMVSCNAFRHNGDETAVPVPSKADSIRIRFDVIPYETFSAVSAEDFLRSGWMREITIRDSTICSKLTFGKDSLKKYEEYYPQGYVDTRAMLIFYQANRPDDSLFVSACPWWYMQLNQEIMRPDSAFWVYLRDVLAARDSTFRKHFHDSPTYL